MKQLFRWSLVVLIPAFFNQCSYSQTANNKKTIMDSANKKNPVYSQTDASKVNLSE
jgi:peptide-methionine (R)-S-oxide reductase